MRRACALSRAPYVLAMTGAGLALALILAAAPAVAGSCRYQSVNGESVETCDNGYTE